MEHAMETGFVLKLGSATCISGNLKPKTLIKGEACPKLSVVDRLQSLQSRSFPFR